MAIRIPATRRKYLITKIRIGNVVAANKNENLVGVVKKICYSSAWAIVQFGNEEEYNRSIRSLFKKIAKETHPDTFSSKEKSILFIDACKCREELDGRGLCNIAKKLNIKHKFPEQSRVREELFRLNELHKVLSTEEREKLRKLDQEIRKEQELRKKELEQMMKERKEFEKPINKLRRMVSSIITGIGYLFFTLVILPVFGFLLFLCLACLTGMLAQIAGCIYYGVDVNTIFYLFF